MASADPGPHARVRNALVMVTVSGLKEETNEAVSASGTGFLVSRDGLVATSYHIRGGLKLIAGTEEYFVTRVVAGGALTQPVRAEYFGDVAKHDVLFLQIPTFGWNTPFVTVEPRPRDVRVTEETELFSSGYPPGTYLTSRGHIANFQGPSGALWAWAVGMNFVPSLSGAPVYVDDGTIVGLAKGANTANPALAYVVPSNLWATQVVALTAQAQSPTRWVRVVQDDAEGAPHMIYEGRLGADNAANLSLALSSPSARVIVELPEGLLELDLSALRAGNLLSLTPGPNHGAQLRARPELFQAQR